MKLLKIHVSGSTRESSAYRFNETYTYFWEGDGDPLEAFRNATREYVENDPEYFHYEKGDYIEYHEVFEQVSDDILEKYGIVSVDRRQNDLSEIGLREWDGFKI